MEAHGEPYTSLCISASLHSGWQGGLKPELRGIILGISDVERAVTLGPREKPLRILYTKTEGGCDSESLQSEGHSVTHVGKRP